MMNRVTRVAILCRVSEGEIAAAGAAAAHFSPYARR